MVRAAVPEPVGEAAEVGRAGPVPRREGRETAVRPAAAARRMAVPGGPAAPEDLALPTRAGSTVRLAAEGDKAAAPQTPEAVGTAASQVRRGMPAAAAARPTTAEPQGGRLTAAVDSILPRDTPTAAAPVRRSADAAVQRHVSPDSFVTTPWNRRTAASRTRACPSQVSAGRSQRSARRTARRSVDATGSGTATLASRTRQPLRSRRSTTAPMEERREAPNEQRVLPSARTPPVRSALDGSVLLELRDARVWALPATV